MFKYLIILMLGCSKFEPNKLTEIVSDDPGVQIGNHNNSKIMINDNDEIFIIEEKSPIDSLIEIEMTNSYLKEKIGIDAFEINACKKDLSDFRLGGNGSYTKVDLQKLIVDEEISVSKLGLNDERQPIILKKV